MSAIRSSLRILRCYCNRPHRVRDHRLDCRRATGPQISSSLSLGPAVPRASEHTSSRPPMRHSSRLRWHRTARHSRETTCDATITMDSDVRIGASFVTVEQAWRNFDKEIPGGTMLEQTDRTTHAARAEKLERANATYLST